MTSRSHSYSTGPTTSNCDRYSATFFHPLPSAISRLPRSSFSSITQSFFSSSWWNSLPKPPLPVQEYSNCFLNKENTTTQKKAFADHPPEPKDQSLFWISPGLFGSPIFSFLRLLCLLFFSWPSWPLSSPSSFRRAASRPAKNWKTKNHGLTWLSPVLHFAAHVEHVGSDVLGQILMAEHSNERRLGAFSGLTSHHGHLPCPGLFLKEHHAFLMRQQLTCLVVSVLSCIETLLQRLINHLSI